MVTFHAAIVVSSPLHLLYLRLWQEVQNSSCWIDISEVVTLGLALNQEPVETIRKIRKLIHTVRARQEYIIYPVLYNVVFNVSGVNKGRPLVFLVGDKVSPTKYRWRFGVQGALDHMKSLNSSIL